MPENNDAQVIPKKRGRPRKNMENAQSLARTASINIESKAKNMEIILKIPLFDNDMKTDHEKKNAFTQEDTSSVCSKKSSDSSSDVANIDNEMLMKEIKKRNEIIDKLNAQIKKLTSGDSDLATENNESYFGFKQHKQIKIIDLNLFSLIDGKAIVTNKTNIACWWCTEQFTTMPCFIPDKCVNGKYYVFGCFCSYNCAKAYNLSIGDDNKSTTRTSLLSKLCLAVLNKSDVKAAPPSEMLKKFGGPKTIDEFRKNSLIVKKEYKSNIPVVIPMGLSIEEINK